ncbi:MAG: hypothetical protein WDZ35_13970 [Crocinitomicaceae bacterium]
MKYLFLIAFFSMLSFSSTAQISFNTGSDELDADLNLVNTDAKKDLPSFKTRLSVEYKVSVKKIDYLLSLNMTPAEVYLALEIAVIAKRSIDEVAKNYQVNKSRGWGYIAKQMGIKPGSAAFHQLKGSAKNKSAGKSNDANNKNNGKGNSQGKGRGK